MTAQPDTERHELEQAHTHGIHEPCGDECPIWSPELHATDPERLDRYAAAIYEGQNSGYSWGDAHPDDKRGCRWDAGYVIAADQAHAAEVRAAALTEAADLWETEEWRPHEVYGQDEAIDRLRRMAAAARPDDTTGDRS